jgi:hypothetical protein
MKPLNARLIDSSRFPNANVGIKSRDLSRCEGIARDSVSSDCEQLPLYVLDKKLSELVNGAG